MHEVFEHRVREGEDRVALCLGDEQITYCTLNARADRLAGRLRSLGVGPEALVALCVDRSVDMIVGILGIAKAGGAYLPVDPSYPGKRIRFLLEDSSAAAVVAVSRVEESLGECSLPAVLWIDQEPPGEEPPPPASQPSDFGPESLAYVIYTSGSTGTPKGVMIEHRNVLRLFQQTHPWFGFDHRDVWTLFHSIGFDFSVWELWGALLFGARLVIVPEEIKRSPEEMYSLLRTHRVTVLNQTPSAFRLLLESRVPPEGSSSPSLRLILFGGERLDVGLLERWIACHGDQRPVLVNMYGITETTVHVTYRRILRRDLAHPELSPIGVPIPDLQVHLLDLDGEPVPDGVPGEIYVSGPGLARGYLKRPALTAERFVRRVDGDDGEGTRLYRSGDRAVRGPDGELVYLGRADEQIKVRGFRIEPREIELCLSRQPQVGALVVVVRDYGGGDHHLLAYVLPAPSVAVTEELAVELTRRLDERARSELPAYMRPTGYRIVTRIPMTPHGKVDREALQELHCQAVATDRGSQVPMTATERVITQISQQVLERTGIEIQDDLFDLGATSLAFIRILAEVNQRLGVSLTGAELGDTASVEVLAACADAALLDHRRKDFA